MKGKTTFAVSVIVLLSVVLCVSACGVKSRLKYEDSVVERGE